MNCFTKASACVLRPSRVVRHLQLQPLQRQRGSTCQASIRERLRREPDGFDAVDARQQVDIERLINYVQELQDRFEALEGQVAQMEERSRDRAVALRSIIKDDAEVEQLLNQDDGQLELEDDAKQEPWDSYRNSFTMLMSKGYLRTVETLRGRLMVNQWELGLRPIALTVGVSRFEDWVHSSKADVSYEVIEELYKDPGDLTVIKDPYVRMKARAIIKQVEQEERVKVFTQCTAEAQRLSSQFTEGEFISKLIPDPLEHGLVDALRKVAMPLSKLMNK